MTNSYQLAVNSVLVQQKALDSVHKIVQTDEFKELLIILNTRVPESRIIVTGVGKNSNLATKASETFASLGIKSLYVNASHYFHGDAGFISNDDIIIHVSRSGKTQEIIQMNKHLKENFKVTQVLLHCNDSLHQSIEEKFNYSIGIPDIVECDEHNLAPTTSTTVLLVLLDVIAIYLSSESGFTPKDFYKYHPGGSLGERLKHSNYM